MVFRIYLSGGMKNITLEEANSYREYIKNDILDEKDAYKYSVDIFNPCKAFNYEDENSYKSNRQVLAYEMYMLRTSDLVLVNFNDSSSLGTMAEISIAYDRNIPVIGINADKNELHDWQVEMCDVIFDSIDEAVSYVKEYYLW